MEIWKPIPTYIGYEVSSHGRVRSLPRITIRQRRNGQHAGSAPFEYRVPGKILKPVIDGPYYIVTLVKNGKSKNFGVHRLVARVFHGKPPKDKPFALHKDDDGFNNRADNLRWGTPKENADDRSAHGNSVSFILSIRDIKKIKSLVAKGVSAADVAEMFDVSKTTIVRIKHGHSWKHIQPSSKEQ